MFCCCCSSPPSHKNSQDQQNKNVKSTELDTLEKKNAATQAKNLQSVKLNVPIPVPIPGFCTQKKLANVITVPIILEEGPHTYESEKVSLGFFRNKAVSAKVQFSYSYDYTQNMITLDKNDEEYGKVPLRFVTYLDNDAPFQVSNITKIETALPPEEKGQSSDADVVAFKEKLDAAVEKIDSWIIETLLSCNIQVVETTPPPKVTPENVNDLIGICGLDEDLEKMMSVDEKMAMVTKTLKSTYGGIQNFTLGRSFANVIGTTNDPKVNGQSWIRLWMSATGYNTPVCTTLNSQCKGRIVGGHVLVNITAPRRVAVGGTCYILPICTRHNVKTLPMTINQRNGSPGNYVRAVILRNFMR